MIKKNYINQIFIYFITLHLTIWTLVPFLSNQNLPLDVIEALAWGSNLDWGFVKHPPVSAFFVEVFYQIFANQDWAYYLLSQIFIITSFLVVWNFSNEFLKNKTLALISVLLLESIYFYNFTSPEFNVNICQIPFWALSVSYCWKSISNNKLHNWIIFGFCAGLGFLSKYLFIYLLAGLVFFLIFSSFKEKKFNYRYFIPIIIFFLVLTPHFLWLIDNEFKTIAYALKRSNLDSFSLINHIKYPLIFLFKQILVLLPFFTLIVILVSKYRFKTSRKDKKLFYLISITLIPFLLIFLTSGITGANIRTMWMTPFYLFAGLLATYFFRSYIDIRKLKNFYLLFLALFILSPSLYLYVSLSNDNKRTDFPGSDIAYLVQNKWDKNFSNKIGAIVGDEWFAGNLSYHLVSRPQWYNSIDSKIDKIDKNFGVIYVGNPKILKKICPGVFGEIRPVGICMIGK